MALIPSGTITSGQIASGNITDLNHPAFRSLAVLGTFRNRELSDVVTISANGNVSPAREALVLTWEGSLVLISSTSYRGTFFTLMLQVGSGETMVVLD